jgi:choline kinase
MYMIILAAGQGTRLRPLTDNVPKCLIEVNGKSLLDWQLQAASSLDVSNIGIVTGYMNSTVQGRPATYFNNPNYETTNMVETLWCASSIFNNNVVISYGDIIFETNVLDSILSSNHPISVVVDKGWRPYWERRFDNILSDAETLKIDGNNQIRSIGQKPKSVKEIDGQYIGLMKFQDGGVDILRTIYNDAKKASLEGRYPLRGQRPFQNLYMTDMLQGIIDVGFPVHQVSIERGWLEIDTLSDLQLANSVTSVIRDRLVINE